MDKLRVGIVGAAGRGRSFFSAFLHNPYTELIALCDINEEGMQATAADIGIEQTYTNYDEMLDRGRLDIVMIGTPMQFHAPQAIAALERDIHVLSEVPATVSMDESRALVAAAKHSKGKYMMAENYCYIRSNVLVKAIARRGLFGTMYFGEGEYIHELKGLNEITKWRRKWQTGVNGATYPTHSLGPVYQWMNERVVSVFCAGAGHHYVDPRGDEYENEDSITMICRMAKGGLINVRVDMLSNRPHKMDYYSLQGTDGCYESGRKWDDGPTIWLRELSEEQKWFPLADLEEKFLPEHWLHMSEEAKASGHWGGDYMEVMDFVQAIVNDEEPPIGLHESLDMTNPGHISQESIAQGGVWIDVPDSRSW